MHITAVACATLILASAVNAIAKPTQQTPPAPPSVVQKAVTWSYPNSTSGLEHLIKDILKAQKTGDGFHAQELIDSLILPDYQRWYLDVFDDETAEAGIASYKASLTSLPTQLAQFFLKVQQSQTSVSAVRFDETCDDNASDHTFGILLSRLRSVPLYELRFIEGGKFFRLFALVYVDGGFRFALLPDPEKVTPHKDSAIRNPTTGAKDKGESGIARIQTIRQGGSVSAAHIIHKEQPVYPEVARLERIQGTIRLHAIIGTDGTIRGLRVMSGACSLSKSAYDAVRKWRYSPTTFGGQSVEVDTTIDVIYSLRQ